jgi:hypothetical protein
VDVRTSGPKIMTASVRLGALLSQEADGGIGDISLARVRFELFGSANGGAIPDRVVDDVQVDASGNALAIVTLPIDSWTVKVLVSGSNGYWVANPVGVSTFTVAAGAPGDGTHGGGWLGHDKKDKDRDQNGSSFSFAVTSVKGGAPKGNAQYVFAGTDGYVYKVKATSWTGGGLSFTSDPSRASFVAKSSVQKLDPKTGRVLATLPNFTMTVDVIDGDLTSPKSNDQLAITVLNPAQAVWRQVGTRATPVDVAGGKVSVQHR